MFSLGNVKERILEKRIRRVEEHASQRIKHVEESLQTVKKIVDDLRKETDALKKQGTALKTSEEVMEKSQKELRESGESLAKEGEEIRKGFEEMKKDEKKLYEKIKMGGLLQEQPVEDVLTEAKQAQSSKQAEKEGAGTASGIEVEDIAIEESGEKGKTEAKAGGKGKAKSKQADRVETVGHEVAKAAKVEEAEKITGFSRSMETPLDKLFEAVNSKGKLRMDQAARIFGVKEKQIDEWARILEEHNLIEIHYPAMGKPVLKLKSRK